MVINQIIWRSQDASYSRNRKTIAIQSRSLNKCSRVHLGEGHRLRPAGLEGDTMSVALLPLGLAAVWRGPAGAKSAGEEDRRAGNTSPSQPSRVQPPTPTPRIPGLPLIGRGEGLRCIDWPTPGLPSTSRGPPRGVHAAPGVGGGAGPKCKGLLGVGKGRCPVGCRKLEAARPLPQGSGEGGREGGMKGGAPRG